MVLSPILILLRVTASDPRFRISFAQNRFQEFKSIKLAPQEQIAVTIWVQIPRSSNLNSANTITVKAVGQYGVQTDLDLTAQIAHFQENNGQVVMEAEHYAEYIGREGRGWSPQTQLPGFIGEGYIIVQPDIDNQILTNFATTSPELQYTINFATPGTYYVWLRGYAPNGAGDSVHIGLDNEPTTTTLTGFAPRAWSWANGSDQGIPITLEISQPGFHTLHLWQREDGLRLDRIVLTTDSTYNPTGDGPPESERFE